MVEIFFNFIYYEIVEAALYVIIYKGIWQFYDILYDISLYSELIVLFANYIIFFVVNLLQRKLMKKYLEYYYSKKRFCKLNLGKILLNIVSIVAFCSLLGIWGAIWRLYETVTLETEYELYILVATHFGSAFILVLFNTSSSLYGFGGSSSDNESIENNPGESNQLFKINFVSFYMKKS
jgi:hypothetical protein